MTYTCMTTFGPEYYEKYGRDALKRMAEYWPGKIVAYGEGPAPADLPKGVEYRDLMDQPDFVHYVRWTSMVPFLQGRLPDGKYEYHFNMAKFGRKVFPITHMQEPFFFLGADVYIQKPIPPHFLSEMLNHKFGAFLFRPGFHVESDFAGYNIQHAKWKDFAHSWRQMYLTGSVVGLPLVYREAQGFHDCWSLQFLLKEWDVLDQCFDITEGQKGDDQFGFHVWPKTRLAEYMVHLKGRLKKDPEVLAKVTQ